MVIIPVLKKFFTDRFSKKPYTYRPHHYRSSKRDYVGLISVGANVVTLILFLIFIAERNQQQSIQAWEVLSTEGGANMGKSLALLTLFQNGENLEYLDLSCKENEKDDCESGAKIRNIDLSPRLKYIPLFDISYADLEKLPLHHFWLPSLSVYDRSTNDDPWFRRLDISGATLTGATFEDVDLRGANLNLANFSEAIISNSRFDYTLLSDAVFHKAWLYDNSFERAAAHGALFDNATLNENNFTLTSLRFARFYYAAACSNNFTLSDLSFVRSYTTASARYNFYRFGEPPVIGNTKKLLDFKGQIDSAKNYSSVEGALQLAVKNSDALDEYFLAPREFDFIGVDPSDKMLSPGTIRPSDFERVATAESQNDEVASMTLANALQWLSLGGPRSAASISPEYPDRGCESAVIVFPYDKQGVTVSFEDQRKARSLISK